MSVPRGRRGVGGPPKRVVGLLSAPRQREPAPPTTTSVCTSTWSEVAGLLDVGGHSAVSHAVVSVHKEGGSFPHRLPLTAAARHRPAVTLVSGGQVLRQLRVRCEVNDDFAAPCLHHHALDVQARHSLSPGCGLLLPPQVSAAAEVQYQRPARPPVLKDHALPCLGRPPAAACAGWFVGRP